MVSGVTALVVLIAFNLHCSPAYGAKPDTWEPIRAIEDCTEVIGKHHPVNRNYDSNSSRLFECHNPTALVATVCDVILENRSLQLFLWSTCPTAKLASSMFLIQMDAADVTGTHSMDACYSRGHILKQRILPNRSVLWIANFVLDILRVYELKFVVVIVDSSTALPARQLLKRVNKRAIHIIIVNMDNSHFDLNVAMRRWYNSHNFLVFCERDNQIRIIKEANKWSLFSESFLWIFEESLEHNVTATFEQLRIEFTANVNIARFLNKQTQMAFRERAVAMTADFRNVSEETLVEYRRRCQAMDFSSRTSWTTSEVRRNQTNHPVGVDLGYALLRVHVKCYRVAELELMGKWTVQRSLEVVSGFTRSVSPSLSGCHFKVGIVHSSPNVILEDGFDLSTATGTDVELLEILSATSEFTYEFVATNETTIGSFEGADWSGLIKQLVEKKIDMILPTLAITAQRQECLDFSAAVHKIGYVVVIKTPGMADEVFSDFVQPFETSVWIMIGVTFAVAVVALTLTHVYGPHVASDKMELHLNWWNSLCILYGIMVQQGADRVPISISGRIVFGSFLLAAMTLMQNYSSILISFLTVNKPLVPFSSLAELVGRADYRIAMMKGTSLIELFSISNEPLFVSAWRKIVSQGVKNSLILDLDVALDAVLRNGKLALLIKSNSVQDLLLTNCSLHAALKDVVVVNYHIGFRQDFPYGPIISQHITRLRETGAMDKLRKKYLVQGRNLCSAASLSAISIQEIPFLLYVVVLGCVFAVLLFVIERLVYACFGHRGLRLVPGIFPQRPDTSRTKDPMPNDIYRYFIKVNKKK